MGDSADFPAGTPAVSDATRLRAGDCVHVYRGTLTDAGPARLFVLAPDAPEAAQAAFERAATAWERCSEYRGIVPVLARGEGPRPWIAVADVDGRRLPETALPVEAKRHVLADVAEGLRGAHRAGYHHLGTTPSHVWVVDAADGAGAGYAGRLDWALERACLLALGDLSGPYTPPELLADPADADGARADVYALGAVAAEAMTDGPAGDDYEGEAARAPAAPGGSPPCAAVDVLSRALAADPADRYDSVYAFKRALLFEAGADPTDGDGTGAGATEREEDTRAGEPGDPGEVMERDGTDSDTLSPVRRRAVLGALGLGVAGTATAGGAWLFGAGGAGDAGTADAAPSGIGPGDDRYDDTGGRRSTPEAAFSFALQPLTVTVAYEGGDTFPAGELSVRSEALSGGERTWSAATDTDPDRPVQRGETAQFAVDGQYDVRVVWEPNEVLLASASGPVDPQDTTVGDVTREQYDLGNTGFTLATAPPPSARRRWRFDTADRVESSPAVVDGVAYFGSNDGSVYAVDAVTGTELWRTRLGSRVWASPTVAHFSGAQDAGRAPPRVFAGNTDGTFYSLDGRDGSREWRAVVGDGYVSGPGVVTLGDERGPFQSTAVLVGGSARLTAFDAYEGVELWRFEAGQYVSGPGILPPREDSARDRTTVFVASSNDTVYALDAHDGRELWSATVEGVATPPTVARPVETPEDSLGYTVFLGSGLAESRGLTALDAADGSRRWHRPTDSDVVASPAVVDANAAAADGGTVFAGDSAGGVYAADARDGELRWTAEVDDGVTSAPIVVDTSGTEWSDGASNTLFFGSWDGNVYGFETASGDARWVFRTTDSVGCSPTVVDGTLYIGNHEGQVYAIGKRDSEGWFPRLRGSH